MREPRLDPVRRPRLPRVRTTLRLMLVAALLLTAAAALYAGEPSCPPPAAIDRTPGEPTPASGDRPSTDRPPDAHNPGGSTPAHSESTHSGAERWAPGAGDARLAAPPGTVGVPVRLADPAALALVRQGDRVDLLVAGRQAGVEATGVLVLAVAIDEGALLLALGPAQARKTATASPTVAYTIIVRA
ncbi:hypothetical protein K1W54_23805 [Micromonospora sp. CPCC 205371]|nr:hypothetical protein [Micromonospora sp. CPCC 205371]